MSRHFLPWTLLASSVPGQPSVLGGDQSTARFIPIPPPSAHSNGYFHPPLSPTSILSLPLSHFSRQFTALFTLQIRDAMKVVGRTRTEDSSSQRFSAAASPASLSIVLLSPAHSSLPLSLVSLPIETPPPGVSCYLGALLGSSPVLSFVKLQPAIPWSCSSAGDHPVLSSVLTDWTPP